MQVADFNSPPFAKTAVMRLLARRGGALRIGPLLQRSGLSVDELCATLNELAHRRWLKVTWRRSPHALSPERLQYVDRITATRFGRARTMPFKGSASSTGGRRRRHRRRPRGRPI